jgi:hypothetical protein
MSVMQARTYMQVFMHQGMFWINSSFTGRTVETRRVTGSFESVLPYSTFDRLAVTVRVLRYSLGLSCARLRINEPNKRAASWSDVLTWESRVRLWGFFPP